MAIFRVLYVDDEPGLLELGRDFLEREGQFTVDTETSAPAALDRLNDIPYDAIISDYQMPGMDGIEFLKRVRSAKNSIPFILFTGRGREEIVIQALNEGADFYLQKGGDPIPLFAELAHKVQRAVLQKRAEDAVVLRESYLSAIIENQPGLIWLKDLDGRFLATNEAFAHSCGKRSSSEVLGRTDLDIWPPDLAEKYRADDVRVIAGKSPLRVEEKIADCSIEKWFETFKMPITDSAGKVIGTTGYAHDITQRRKADDTLKTIRELEREFAALPSGARVEELATEKIQALTGAVVATFNQYDPDKQLLRPAAIRISPAALKSIPGAMDKLTRLLGMRPEEITVPVSRAAYQDIRRSLVGKKETVTELSHGRIPPLVSAGIRRLSGISRFIQFTHIIDGELYGTSIIGLRPDQPDPPEELLDSFAHMVAVSLRRQRAEAAVRESDERLRDIVGNISAAFYIYDKAANRFIYISPAYENIWGRPGQSLVDNPLFWTETVIPEDLPRLQESIRRDPEGVPGDMEFRIHRPDGTIRWIRSRNFPIRDLQGRISRIAGIAEDITELNTSRSALSESEEKFRLLVENSLESVSIIDFTGKGIFANRATARLLEMNETTDLRGRNVMEYLTPESQELAAADLRQVAGGRDAYLTFYTIRTAKGNTRHIECTGRAIRYEGTPAILLSLHDITGLRNAEERLRMANRQLTLLTGITRHDILNKVSVIRGFLQMAKKSTDPALGQFLDRIGTETMAIQSQIEFTRVYQDLGSHEPQWLALADVMPVSLIPPQVTLSFDGKDFRIYADPMLKTVFSNLLDNSIRHGERVTAIRVFATPAGKDLRVVWEDNGVGIPAGEKELVFDRGYGKNTGLGMFLAKEILSLTGITIRENGEPGTGARFEITVPEGAHRPAGE